jgi:hypothetical protein
MRGILAAAVLPAAAAVLVADVLVAAGKLNSFHSYEISSNKFFCDTAKTVLSVWLPAPLDFGVGLGGALRCQRGGHW